MRRKPMMSGAVALILACIYILGLVFGIWLISYMSSGVKREELLSTANNLAEQYVNNEKVHPWPRSCAAIIAFSSDGQLLDFWKHIDHEDYNFVEHGKIDLQKILRQEGKLWLVMFAQDESTSENTALGYTSFVYAGVPIIAENEVTGAMIWVRELRDLLDSILAYICSFTVVFAIAAAFMLLSLRKHRQYEQLRRDYVDNITHELKTPIASIKAVTEVLSDGMEKSLSVQNMYYGLILKEANRQERMICEVLELSNLQSCRLEKDRHSVTGHEVFAPICDKYAMLCDLMGITFTVTDEVKALPRLFTNAKYIQTVMDALLSNAVKFVPEEGEIRVSVRTSRKQATICVEDNGAGISKDELPHVFERFYKGSCSENESGSGLGLAIAKEILESMNEKIWIHSKEGEGTQVYFTIRLKRIF